MSDQLNRVRFISDTVGTGSSIHVLAAFSVAYFTPIEGGAVDGRKYTYLITQGNDFEIQQDQVWTASTSLVARGTPAFSKIGGVAGTTKISLDNTAVITFGASALDLMFSQTRGADVAAAATLDLQSVQGGVVNLTGTTGISAVTLNDGQERWALYTGAGLTITVGSSLVGNDGGGNVTLATGDLVLFRGFGSGVTRFWVLRAARRTVTAADVNAFVVGPNGTTNPSLQVDTSAASAATGLKITALAAAAGLALSVISSGANESLTIDAKGTGTISLNSTATGSILGPNGTVSLPAWSFASDPDSGMYRIGANNIGIGVNGAKVLDIGTGGLTVTGALVVNTGGLYATIASAATNLDAAAKFYDGTNTAYCGLFGASGGGTTGTWCVYNGGIRLKVDTAGIVTVPASTASSSTTTGALVVTGGVGIGGAVYAAGDLVVTTASGANISINATSGYPSWQIQRNGTIYNLFYNDGSVAYLWSNTAGSHGVSLVNSGDSWASISDARLPYKRTAREITNDLPSLDGFFLYENEIDGKTDLFVKAQEFYDLFPHLIEVGSGDDDYVPTGLSDAHAWKMHYDRVGVVALAYAKRHSAEIDAIKRHIGLH